MLRIISGVTSDIDEELYVCFTDCHKALHYVNGIKLMQTLKESVID
jgi:hypothetical protein